MVRGEVNFVEVVERLLDSKCQLDSWDVCRE